MIQEGLLFLVSGASGTGKGTILNKLRGAKKNIRYSISATTRRPRDGEVNGVNYFFKSIDEFKEMISKNELIEWDIYCSNYYGTPSDYINKTLKQGYDVVLEVTVNGALNVMKQYSSSISIFILPPSFDELERRIKVRGTETEEVILARLHKAKSELKQIEAFDYIIVNDDINEAVNSFNSIIISEKLRTNRNADILNKFILDQEEN